MWSVAFAVEWPDFFVLGQAKSLLRWQGGSYFVRLALCAPKIGLHLLIDVPLKLIYLTKSNDRCAASIKPLLY